MYGFQTPSSTSSSAHEGGRGGTSENPNNGNQNRFSMWSTSDLPTIPRSSASRGSNNRVEFNSNTTPNPATATSFSSSSSPVPATASSSPSSNPWTPLSFHWRRQRPAPPPPLIFSQWSSPAVPSGGWACEDFMVGVGMVIIQPSSGKMVIVRETKKQYCFLPRGRKDLGETLQEAALREAYEESGYKAEFLPLYKFTHQPAPPSDKGALARPDTEPVYMSLNMWGPKIRRGKRVDRGGEYFISWFVGQIPENPVHYEGTGMPDEQNYKSVIVTFDEALRYLGEGERAVVRYARYAYECHLQVVQQLERERSEREREAEMRQGTGIESGTVTGMEMEVETEVKEGDTELVSITG
ncbi:hypothetical protein D9757_008173 [Collybiopsis confluens]|uniref:Nudix hydrolase domain-containing protein n=1 Tax=Collybiopsis confluens TaxID=2823264 RepID=A0A8H5HDX0_9AGAR|nr:hypothetical protein D9757_008173 [Collybiopsis confluens]